MYYPCSENKGADQLRGYREADLRLCFRLCKLLVFSCTGSYIFFYFLQNICGHNICNKQDNDSIFQYKILEQNQKEYPKFATELYRNLYVNGFVKLPLFWQDKGVNLVHIESRPSKKGENDYEFYVDCDNTKGNLNLLLPELKKRSKSLHILSRRRTKSSSRCYWTFLIKQSFIPV